MKRALITGISGFVGGHLGELLLSQGYEVHGTCFGDSDRVIPGVPFVLHEMNLCDAKNVNEVFQSVQPDVIFHLAAQSSAALSWKKPALTVAINLGGTVNVLETVRSICPQSSVLLIGSSEEYGRIAADAPIVDERREAVPVNPYAVTKLAQNRMGSVYAGAYQLKVVMTRAFNHIGPRQSGPFVIPSFAQQIVDIERGKQPPVIKVGNLEASRDFSDVRDVVRAYWLLSQKGIAGETYNIGSGKAHKIRDILDLMLSMAQVPIEVQVDPARLRPSDTPLILCNASKLQKDTDWKPQIPLEQSIADTLAWFRRRK